LENKAAEVNPTAPSSVTHSGEILEQVKRAKHKTSHLCHLKRYDTVFIKDDENCIAPICDDLKKFQEMKATSIYNSIASSYCIM
jgi:hypothetical protein